MALTVAKVDVWQAELDDRVGALSEKLSALSQAGADLEFVLARRTPEMPGKAIIFVYPLRGAKQLKAAAAGGFAKSQMLQAVRVEGPDKPGLGAKMAASLADAGLNLRGLTATVVGRRFAAYVALDTAADAAKAAQVLKGLK